MILIEEEIEDKKTLYEQLTEAFSSVKMFVSVCINRAIKYNSMPDKYHIDEVNKNLEIIYKNVGHGEGLKLTNAMLEDQEKVLKDNNVNVIFENQDGFPVKKKAKLKFK